MPSYLVGWKVHSMVAGISSVIVAAETSVISWGVSLTCGEPGYGEDARKSSTSLRKVDASPVNSGKHIPCVRMKRTTD